MNIEDFDNDLSSDDEDFCPDKHVESSDNSGPDDDDREGSDKESGTKRTEKRKSSKRQKTKPSSDDESEEEKIEPTVIDPEEEKRKADAIWADFLSGTENPSKASENNGRATAASSSKATPPTSKPIIPTKAAPVAVTKIFEFAGETVEIPAKAVESPSPSSTQPKLQTPAVKRSGGGLSSVLNQLSKKSKLSVLEKTKIDWDGFKSNEGINEELQTHNRGREGQVWTHLCLIRLTHVLVSLTDS